MLLPDGKMLGPITAAVTHHILAGLHFIYREGTEGRANPPALGVELEPSRISGGAL